MITFLSVVLFLHQIRPKATQSVARRPTSQTLHRSVLLNFPVKLLAQSAVHHAAARVRPAADTSLRVK